MCDSACSSKWLGLNANENFHTIDATFDVIDDLISHVTKGKNDPAKALSPKSLKVEIKNRAARHRGEDFWPIWKNRG
jgi:hypothetical protein